MAIQPIRLFGDPVLRTPADPVGTFDKELRKLVRDLTETLLDEGGAGLAAPSTWRCTNRAATSHRRTTSAAAAPWWRWWTPAGSGCGRLDGWTWSRRG